MNGAGSRGYGLAAVVLVAGIAGAWYFFRPGAMQVGTQLVREGRVDEALAVWSRACKRKNVEACAAAAVVRLQRADIPGARTLVERAVAADPKHMWSLVLQGRLKEVEGKPDEAKVLYEEAERLHPDSAVPPSSLGKLAMDRHDLAEAERCAERAIAADPRHGTGYAMRGRILVLTSSFAEAAEAFGDAADRNGMVAEDWILFADTMEKLGEGQLRRQILEDGNERSPDDPRLLTALGVERWKANNAEGSVAALRRATEISPLAEPRVYLGITFLESNRPDFAAPRFEEALRIAPDDVDVMTLLATARANNGETEAALELMGKVLSRTDLTPAQRTRTLFLRASVYESAGRLGDAKLDLAELTKIDPNLQDANWLAGHIALSENRNEDAKTSLEKAASSGQFQVPIFEDMARVLARLGQHDAAINYLESLFTMKVIDAAWVKAHPEFRPLEDMARFKLMMAGAGEPPEEDGPEDLAPSP